MRPINHSIYMNKSNAVSLFLHHCKRYRPYTNSLIKCATITLHSEPALTGSSSHFISQSSLPVSEKRFLYDTWEKANYAQTLGEYYKSMLDWITSILNQIPDAIVVSALLRCYITNDISRLEFSNLLRISDNTLNKKIRSKIEQTITQKDIDSFNEIQSFYAKIRSTKSF